jgi:late competence protein required for DNA uptake (superfamily II DNA/RNA helicase)
MIAIKGSIVNEAPKPAANLPVLAWDGKLSARQRIVSSRTDSEGSS